MDLNSVSLVGRLTRDIEAPTGNGPARFSVAVNRRIKQGDTWGEEADFFNVEYWHRSILPYLAKGKQIALRGSLRLDRWTDKETLSPRSRVVIVAEDVQLLGTPTTPGEAPARTGGSPVPVAPPRRPASPPVKRETETRTETAPDGFEDDIPF